MEWKEAQTKIRASITINTDLNTPDAHYRFVQEVEGDGFYVPIGENIRIFISMQMLEKCFKDLCDARGYSGKTFRLKFPREARNHPCHIHVVGQIFVKSGIATQINNAYFLKKSTFL